MDANIHDKLKDRLSTLTSFNALAHGVSRKRYLLLARPLQVTFEGCSIVMTVKPACRAER